MWAWFICTLLLHASEADVYVSPRGADVPSCGAWVQPCLSIPFAIQQLRVTDVLWIDALTTNRTDGVLAPLACAVHTLSAPASLTGFQNLTVVGYNLTWHCTQATILQTTIGSIGVEANGVVQFRDLIFVLPPSSGSMHVGATVNLLFDHCSFIGPNTTNPLSFQLSPSGVCSVLFQDCVFTRMGKEIVINVNKQAAYSSAFVRCQFLESYAGVVIRYQCFSGQCAMSLTDCVFLRTGPAVAFDDFDDDPSVSRTAHIQVSFTRVLFEAIKITNDEFANTVTFSGVGERGSGQRSQTEIVFVDCEWTLNSVARAVQVLAGNNVTVAMQGCRFLYNTGGAVAVQLPPDPVRPDHHGSFEHVYTNHVSVSASTFKGNNCTSACTGAALSLINGDLRIMTSVFLNNLVDITGGALYTAGTAQLTLVENLFAGNTRQGEGDQIVATHTGPTLVANSSILLNALMDGEAYAAPSALRLQQTVAFQFASNTTLLCLAGSNFDVTLNKDIRIYEESAHSTIKVVFLQVGCDICTEGFYSIEVPVWRRDFDNMHVSLSQWPAYDCFPCPRGGNCDYGGAMLLALDGYWGDVTEDSLHEYQVSMGAVPRQVSFTFCPMNYCNQALCSRPARYNKSETRTCAIRVVDSLATGGGRAYSDTWCTVGRTGRLCGTCLDGYSQTLFGVLCVPDNACDDGHWYWLVYVILLILYLVYFALSFVHRDPGDIRILVYYYQIAGAVLSNQDRVVLLRGLFDLNFDLSSTAATHEDATGYLCPIRGLTTLGSLFLGYLAPFVLWSMLSLCYVASRLYRRCARDDLKERQPLILPSSPEGRVGLTVSESKRSEESSLQDGSLAAVKPMGVTEKDSTSKPGVDERPKSRYTSFHSFRRDSFYDDAMARDTENESHISHSEVDCCSFQGIKRLLAEVSFPIAAVRVGLFCFSSLIKTTLRLLNCQPVSGKDGKFLFEAATIECWTGWQILLFVPFVLLMLTPLVLFILIRRRSKRDLDHNRLNPTPTSASAAGTATFSQLSSLSGVSASRSLISQATALLSLSPRPPNSRPTTIIETLYHYICLPYRTTHAYWESILIAHVLLAASIRIFDPNPLTGSLVLALVNTVFLAVQCYAMPFRSAIVNSLQVIFLFCLGALAILNTPADFFAVSNSSVNFDTDPFRVLQGFALWLPIAVILVLIASRLYVQLKRFPCACARAICGCCVGHVEVASAATSTTGAED